MAVSVPKPFDCCICYETHAFFLTPPCGHKICAPCLTRTLATANSKCPQCRALLSNNKKYPAEICSSLDGVHREQLERSFPFVCGYGSKIEIQQWINTGININATDDISARNGLWWAASFGDIHTIELLLEHNVDLDHSDLQGSTPLMISTQEGHLDVVKTLVQYRANINARMKNGITPLFISAHNGHTEVVEYLLEHDANVNLRRDTGATPLFNSALNNYPEIVTLLLQHNANVNQTLHDGVSPLFMSAQMGHVEVVNVLLEHRANVNQREQITQDTPLIISTAAGHLGVVLTLLKYNADLNLSNSYGINAFDISREEGHAAILDTLQRHNTERIIKLLRGDTEA